MNWKTILSVRGKERKRTRDVEQQGLVVIQVEYTGELGFKCIQGILQNEGHKGLQMSQMCKSKGD